MVIEDERDKEETENVRMGKSMMRNEQAQPQRRRPIFQANFDGDENCQGKRLAARVQSKWQLHRRGSAV